MMTETLILPPGFHFTPTDEELITFYLSRKAMGLEMPWKPLLEKTIYGENADPWDVFSDVEWDTCVTGEEGKECKKVKSVVYVFTKLSKVNGKTRIARSAGCGTWDGQTGARKIYNNSGQLIGQMKMFTFTVKNPPSDGTKQRDHHWIMHAYSLAGVSLNCELPYKDYVMCRITRSSKEKSPQQSISRSVTEECSSSCGENPLMSNDNKKRSAADLEHQEVASQKKQKVDSMSLLEWRSTHVGSSGDNDNFAWTPDSGYANTPPLQQFPMPVDDQPADHGRECSYREDDKSWLDILLECENGDIGSLLDSNLDDDDDELGTLIDIYSLQFLDVSLSPNTQ
ncbi:NAC domain-containing protein 60 [Sesamum alatum]|uniref:NAC domain-containing protein 60 n=1 Tax=Sesamum alatum TaxID=300844 RepID=A0AAE2CSK8_9LAMI|nr:NAC domain-containing protein 60 [Sesamum alatum]